MSDITTQARQDERRRAYYTGREMAFRGERDSTNPHTQTDLHAAWQRGHRDATAENRLDADTEWDND